MFAQRLRVALQSAPTMTLASVIGSRNLLTVEKLLGSGLLHFVVVLATGRDIVMHKHVLVV